MIFRRYIIKELTNNIEYKELYIVNENQEIARILTDSRSLSIADDTLFFAISTNTGDGHLYIDQLIEKGVNSFVIEKDLDKYKNRYPQKNWILVDNSIKALQDLALFCRELNIKGKMIAITGSNGKTIVKNILAELLEDLSPIYSPHSYNSQIGVALSLWSLPKKDLKDNQIAIIEAGISAKGEMETLAKMIKADIGIFTSIGDAHSNGFASLEEKIEEKLKLFESAKKIIIGSNAKLVRDIIISKYGKDRIVYWSFDDKDDSNYYVRYKILNNNVSIIEIDCDNGKKYKFETSFIYIAYIIDFIHAIVTIITAFPKINISKLNIGKLSNTDMRMELKEAKNNNIIINDSYSLDLQSLAISLDLLRRKSEASKGYKIAIISEIEQSRMTLKDIAIEINNLAMSYQVDELILIGNYQKYKDIFLLKTKYFNSVKELIDSKILDDIHSSNILIKGARAYKMELISRSLELKNHPTALEVNLKAIKENLQHYRLALPNSHKIVAMIKADAYGLGAFELARLLQELGIDYLAVAMADEGKELRNKGIYSPIMIMNPEKDSFDTLFNYNLEPEVYSFEMLKLASKEAEKRNQKDFPIHIKLDTGMHRLGFMSEDIDKLIQIVKNDDNIKIKSIFSHLSASDDIDEDVFTQSQFDIFEINSSKIIENLSYKPIRHILNTAGIERFGKSKYAYDMVRLGIGLYGLDPLNGKMLKNVARLKSSIIQIKELKAGENIGYSHKTILEQDRKIAIIPIGYADGFRRSLGNGHYFVEVDGTLCPTIGNICMDASIIDISNVPTASLNSEVIIFGSPNCSISNMANILDTIPYEIITTVGSRVRRLYTYNDNYQ